jgi:hypothetical protein
MEERGRRPPSARGAVRVPDGVVLVHLEVVSALVATWPRAAGGVNHTRPRISLSTTRKQKPDSDTRNAVA